MKHHIVIVASRFNEKYVDGLIDSALKVLKTQRVDIVRVPGAFEIPLGIQRAIRREKPDAVIALGVIWKGKTLHAELLSFTITDALMRLGLENNTPVIHEVLTVNTEAEAKARCFGKKLNRGTEAAHAALAVLQEDASHG